MNTSTIHFLLSRFMETEYQTKLLANVSVETFEQLKQDMTEQFADWLTDVDIKEAWKCWFDWAADNGTLISSELQFVNPDVSWQHDELRIIDLVIELAHSYIDRL